MNCGGQSDHAALSQCMSPQVAHCCPEPIRHACPQLAKADFASSSQHVREGQRVAELETEIEAQQRQALALGAAPSADASPEAILQVRLAEKKRAAA
jgi:hypothetical protein